MPGSSLAMPIFTKFDGAKLWMEQNSISHLYEIPDNAIMQFYRDLLEDKSLLQQLQSNQHALTARRNAMKTEENTGADVEGKKLTIKGKGAGDSDSDTDTLNERVHSQGRPHTSTMKL